MFFYMFFISHCGRLFIFKPCCQFLNFLGNCWRDTVLNSGNRNIISRKLEVEVAFELNNSFLKRILSGAIFTKFCAFGLHTVTDEAAILNVIWMCQFSGFCPRKI